jgi:hypothetical protein
MIRAGNVTFARVNHEELDLVSLPVGYLGCVINLNPAQLRTHERRKIIVANHVTFFATVLAIIQDSNKASVGKLEPKIIVVTHLYRNDGLPNCATENL